MVGLKHWCAAVGMTAAIMASVTARSDEAKHLMSAEELGGVSAGAASHTDILTNQSLNASSSGNSISADSIKSGDVTFSNSALNGFNGVGNIIINTGNNNIIQGSLSVTVSAPNM